MILNENIEKYITAHCSDEETLLTELNRETYLKALNPRMISGHPQGKVLELLSKIICPKFILELGTYTGYSAICLAKGLQPDGHLHTIERNDEIIKFPRSYFQKAGLNNKITIHTGDALEIIPQLPESFDLIFMDADKQQYPDYYALCIDKLNPGGVMLADNVLWSGKVVETEAYNEPDTSGILKFNKLVKSDERVEVIILPIRDGLSVIRKSS